MVPVGECRRVDLGRLSFFGWKRGLEVNIFASFISERVIRIRPGSPRTRRAFVQSPIEVVGARVLLFPRAKIAPFEIATSHGEASPILDRHVIDGDIA